MELYHGSIYDIRRIKLMNSAGNKDFGPGFYTTDLRVHAENRALGQAERYNKRSGVTVNRYVYTYTVNKDILRRYFKILEFRKETTEWLDLIVGFRINEKYRLPYDIIIGPTADASARGILASRCFNHYDLDSGKLWLSRESKKGIIKDLLPKKAEATMGLQYCFKTQRVIDFLNNCHVRRELVHEKATKV